MSLLTVELPPDLSPERARLLLALQLFREDEVSLGYAAELAGCSISTFAEALSRRRLAVIDYSPDDIEAESDVLSRMDRGDGSHAA